MRRIKVVHVPYHADLNPYQMLLTGSLEKLGIEVIGEKCLPIFTVSRLAKKYWKLDIIHIHWQHPFILGKTRLRTVVKSISFVFELLVIKLLGINVVWTVHNLKNHENKHQKLELFSPHFLLEKTKTKRSHFYIR